MANPTIKVQGLGKQYVLGARESGRETFREMLISSLGAPVRRFRQLSGAAGTEEESIWALKDVSFEINEGEVVGIIGRNGAGKSTLLKILSRITQPTQGRAEIHGRVASLLEVGTGFHTELTGRENIYLNGAILGMSRREIDRKFDEIVDFSGVEKFIDTAVKRYSSGMHVRLAFAVAAYLEPEILIVDEVLAVGDAEFQDKCLGRMSEVSKAGRTVIFVSHNMSAVQSLCTRAILLKGGRIACDDSVQTVVSHYLSDAASNNKMNIESWTDRNTTGEARIISLEYDDGRNSSSIMFGGDLRIRIRARFPAPFKNPVFGVVIHDNTGVPLSDLHSIHEDFHLGTVSGEIVVEVILRNLSLYPRRYLLSPWVNDPALQRNLDFPKLCAAIEVHPAAGKHGDLKLHKAWGSVYLPAHWRLLENADAELA